jgi:hypothetical protein
MTRFFRQPLDDVVACLEPIVAIRNPVKALAPLFISLVVSWIVYVPIHELLHAFGCWLTGGTVTRLEISPRYGGAIAAEFFPFVVSGGEYAGRLSGFDTKGSDLIYLATDFMPYMLTVLIGIPLLKLAGRRRRPLLFGLAIVTGLAPFYNIPGDYYEMASIITTRAATPVVRLVSDDAPAASEPPCPEIEGAPTAAYRCLRSDDIFKLLESYVTKPAEVHLQGVGQMIVAAGVILVGLVLDVLLAFATYMLGHGFARLILGLSPPRPATASS